MYSRYDIIQYNFEELSSLMTENKKKHWYTNELSCGRLQKYKKKQYEITLNDEPVEMFVSEPAVLDTAIVGRVVNSDIVYHQAV